MNFIAFKDVPIDGEFQNKRINTGFSLNYGSHAIMKYRKISGNKALCIDQEGYGNKRAINGKYNFAPNTIVQTL